MYFDPNEVDDTEFELLPEGTYRLGVIDGDLKRTKAGTGQYVAIALQVLSGQHKDRKVFDNFNVENPSEKAQQIGRAQLKRFLAAIGVTGPVDIGPAFFARITGKSTEAEIIHETGNDNVVRNKVRKYLAPQQAAPAQGRAQPQPQARTTSQRRAQPAPMQDEMPPPPGLDDIPF